MPRYRIADLVVDVGRRTVLRGSSEIHLSKLSFELLQTLLESAPNVMSNEDLARKVWKGVIVGPETVTQRLKVLRDALGDDPATPRYIAGLRGHGYRILPEVTLNSAETEPAPHEAPESVPTGRRRRPAILVAAAALTAALAYVAVDGVRSLRQRGPSQTESASLTARSLGGASTAAATPPAEEVFAPPPRSVAVLPFINMSGDASQEYFSDGLTEELLNSLSQINELQVSARTSSFSFKGKHVKIGTIARELNVGAILEGSVRRSGNTIRVTAQLNNAVTGFHLWSQTYDRNLSDVLQLQTDIANAVANALKVTLLHDVAAKIELGGTHKPAALDAYLRASKIYFGANEAKGVQVALDWYREAIRLDPNYAIAFADRSLAFNFYAGVYATGQAVRNSFDKALSDAHRAVALAPELAEAHLALAKRLEDGSLDFAQASAEYERAMALEPGNVRLLREYGLFAVWIGRTDEGSAAVRRATVLDPLNAAGHTRLGWTLLFARRYQESVAANADGLLLDPDDIAASVNRGLAYYALGDPQDARSSCEAKPNHWYSHACLAITYEKLGRHADAQTELATFKASMGDAQAYWYAAIYAQWGNTAKALEWLDTAVRLRDSGLVQLKTDPLMDPLRNEPRFQAIERALKLPDG